MNFGFRACFGFMGKYWPGASKRVGATTQNIKPRQHGYEICRLALTGSIRDARGR